MSNAHVPGKPQLKFPFYSDEEMEDNFAYIEMKGYCVGAVWETADGVCYPVSFVTPLRANSEIECNGKGYFEIGLILVSNTKLATMQEAAMSAWLQGFFDGLKPIDRLSSSPYEAR